MKTNKTQVVLIPVSYTDSRKVCESIENQTFENVVELNKQIEKELGSIDADEQENTEVLIYPITDYMDEVNNQQLDVLTDYFITYVEIG
jgi:hypothetical protein